MAQPTFRCVEFVEWVTDWTEGALADDERLMLEEHLAVCPHCTEYLAQLRWASSMLPEARGVVAGDSPAQATRAALLEAFRRERDA